MIMPPRRRRSRKILTAALGGASLGLSACTVLGVSEGPLGVIVFDAGPTDAGTPLGIGLAPDAGGDAGEEDAGTMMGIGPAPDAGTMDASTPLGIGPAPDAGEDAG